MKNMENKLKLDPLTKLWTQGEAEKLIEGYQREGGKYEGDTFFLIHLDGWKAFHKKHGSEISNSILQQISFILGKSIRKADIAARVGESTFVFYVLGCASRAKAGEKARQMMHLIDEVPSLCSLESRPTAVIGAVLCHGVITNYQELLEKSVCAAGHAMDTDERIHIINESCEEALLVSRLPVIEKQEPYQAAGGLADIEFITELTDTLLLGRDMALGIEMALERLCRYFDAERAYIAELASDEKYFEVSYEWNQAVIRVGHENLKQIPEFLVRKYQETFDENGIFACNCLEDLGKDHRMMAERQRIIGTKAMMQSALVEEKNFIGYISICDRIEKRLWSQKEKSTFLMASKIISVNVLQMRFTKYSNRVAYIDLLTDAWNLNKFLLEAKPDSRQDDSRSAVITFDLKNFKILNMEYGYESGNLVLKEVSNILRRHLEENESFARIEADNFVFLVYYEDKEALYQRVSRLFTHIERIAAKLKLDFQFICMAGICEDCGDHADLNTMIERANIARKSIKDYHKSKYALFDKEVEKKRNREKYYASKMKEALRTGEFKVYYQPKVDVRTGKYVSLEALVRWKPRGGELIGPDDFIPLFEKNGFISEIDLYVFEQVCKEISGWMAAGKKCYSVAVNISKVHIRRVNFLEQLDDLCRKYHVPPELIELEITESVFLNDEYDIVEIAEQIKKKGFKLSMDDFGTGYSSLSLLKDLPVDILKLDREFFRESMTKREKIIISNIIHMASELEIQVISEGIETREHEQFLREIGCNTAQGYLYAKPSPLEELADKLW